MPGVAVDGCGMISLLPLKDGNDLHTFKIPVEILLYTSILGQDWVVVLHA